MQIIYAHFCYQIKLLNTYNNKIPCLQGVILLKFLYVREIVKVQHYYMRYIIVELLGSKPLSCTICDYIKFCDYILSDIFLIQITVVEMIESVDYVMLGEIVFCIHFWNQLNYVFISYVMLCEYTAQTKLMEIHHRVNQTKGMVSCGTGNNIRENEDLTGVSGMPFSCMECGTGIDSNIKEPCHEDIVANAGLIANIYYKWINMGKMGMHKYTINIMIDHTYVKNRTKWDKWSFAIINSNG